MGYDCRRVTNWSRKTYDRRLSGTFRFLIVISDIREDVSEIILNLKELKLKADTVEDCNIVLNVKGEKIVTGADVISKDGRVEILNPEQHIATLSKNAKLNITMKVMSGKGYALSAANKDEEAPVGTIPIDSVFSPIKRVKYVVGKFRVGQKTDYDKLTLEVWTERRIAPKDALYFL